MTDPRTIILDLRDAPGSTPTDLARDTGWAVDIVVRGLLANARAGLAKRIDGKWYATEDEPKPGVPTYDARLLRTLDVPRGLTMAGIAVLSGCHVNTMRKRVAKAVQAGHVRMKGYGVARRYQLTEAGRKAAGLED